MANQDVYLQGKCKWAKFVTPDLKYKVWSAVLWPNAESYDKVLKMKAGKPGIDGILNVIKKDEDGYYLTVKRKTQRMMKGSLVNIDPPEVLGPDKQPLRNALVGNGSDITVKLRWYDYPKPTGGRGSAIELTSALVDNLVPFEMKRDFDPDQAKQVAGLTDQTPQPLF